MKFLLTKKLHSSFLPQEISTKALRCAKMLKTARFLNNYFTLRLKR